MICGNCFISISGTRVKVTGVIREAAYVEPGAAYADSKVAYADSKIAVEAPGSPVRLTGRIVYYQRVDAAHVILAYSVKIRTV